MRARIVVDANVAASAGKGRGAREPAPSAVAALDALRARAREAGDLRLAMNEALNEEWIRSEGAYALAWLADMYSRRLVDEVTGEWTDGAALLAAAASNHRGPIRKDLHVVGLAMLTDRRIVSRERKLPRYLRRTLTRPSCPAGLDALAFVNPDDVDAAGWLATGAPYRNDLCLGAPTNGGPSTQMSRRPAPSPRS